MALIGTGFYDGLVVLFGGRAATDVTIHSETAMMCKVPPGEGPGRVLIAFDSFNRQRLPAIMGRQPSYTYVDTERRDGVPLAMNAASGDPSILDEDYDIYKSLSQVMEQYAPHQNHLPQQFYGNTTINNSQHRPTSRHGIVTPPPSETPPTYEDVKAEDSRLQEMKDTEFLTTIGAALADVKAAAESELVKAESSRSQPLLGGNSQSFSTQGEEPSLLELTREVKGLKNDWKLWWFWVCRSFPFHLVQSRATRLMAFYQTSGPPFHLRPPRHSQLSCCLGLASSRLGR